MNQLSLVTARNTHQKRLEASINIHCLPEKAIVFISDRESRNASQYKV